MAPNAEGAAEEEPDFAPLGESSNVGFFVRDGVTFIAIAHNEVVGQSTKGNPLICTSHGYVTVPGTALRLSINGVPAKEKAASKRPVAVPFKMPTK